MAIGVECLPVGIKEQKKTSADPNAGCPWKNASETAIKGLARAVKEPEMSTYLTRTGGRVTRRDGES